MVEHIYVNCSLEDVSKLRFLKDFVHNFDYNRLHEYPKLLPNEIGYIKSYNVIHFLAGNYFPNPFCPWCNGPAEIHKEITENRHFYRHWMECMKCGARGPTMNITYETMIHKINYDEIINIITKRWELRNSWYNNFKNPYESITNLNQHVK